MTPAPGLAERCALARREFLRLIALTGAAKSLGVAESAPARPTERERDERRRKVYEFFQDSPG